MGTEQIKGRFTNGGHSVFLSLGWVGGTGGRDGWAGPYTGPPIRSSAAGSGWPYSSARTSSAARSPELTAPSM